MRRLASVDGLPADPLTESYPDPHPEGPRDPMADLDWASAVGRWPHPLYRKALRGVPPRAGRKELLEAEAKFLRACRDAGIVAAQTN